MELIDVNDDGNISVRELKCFFESIWDVKKNRINLNKIKLKK